MKKTALVLCVALTGCGSYSLGVVSPMAGQLQQQTEHETLFCKDKAKNEVNTSARHAAAFVAGATIIGVPLVAASERISVRKAFSACMAERGYTVEVK